MIILKLFSLSLFLVSFPVISLACMESFSSSKILRSTVQGTSLKNQAQHILNRKITAKEESAISMAHNVGISEIGKDGQNPAGIDNYTKPQLLRKIRILARGGGFNQQKREALISNGVVGNSKKKKLERKKRNKKARRKKSQSDRTITESLERLIKQVSQNKTIPLKLSSCGANCFQIDSSPTSLPRIIKIDSDLEFPIQKEHILTTPPFNTISDPITLGNIIRRLLIGHELHPYTSTLFQTTTLRPSQRMAINDFKESLESGYQSFLHISPTSTGKGVVLAKNLIEKLSGDSAKKISFITVDKVKIVDQLSAEIQSEVQKANFDLRQLHWIAGEGKDFIQEINQALSSEKPTVITITSRSFIIQMEKLEDKNPTLYKKLLKQLDGIYIDEVHHLGAPKTLEFVLDLKEKSEAFVYGTTATPVHRDVEIQNLFQKIHWSYLEEGNFDTYTPSMVVEQLVRSIERGDITPFNDIYVLMGEDIIDMTYTPLFIQRKGSLLFSINPHYYSQLREILSGIFDSNKKGMIIASTIKEAEDLASFFNRTSDITFEAYHSDMKPELKEAVFKNSREQEAHYIVAVRALDEGVNLPHLSAYIDLNSHVSIKQMVHRMGRVLRPSLNKLKADIFILSSYRNFEMTKELMDNVTQLRETIKDSNRSTSASPSRERLRNLAARSYNFFLKQQQFWASKDEKERDTKGKDENSLDTYFHYLSQVRRRFPPLSQSKLDTLLIQFKKTGDIEVRNEIVSRNLGLVTMVAQKYKWAFSSIVDMMDLVQEGNRGLIKAVDAYRIESGYRFSTFAVSYIEGYIKRFIFEQNHIVRIKQSPDHSAVFFNLERQKDHFSSQNEVFDVVAAAENMSTDKTTVKPETIRWMDSHLQDTISFNQPVTGQRNPKGLVEDIQNPEKIQSFEEVHQTGIPLHEDTVGAQKILETFMISIMDFLPKLTPQQQDIFIKRLLTIPPVTLDELGETYGISRERVRQIENKAKRRFNKPFNWDSSRLPIELQNRFFARRSSRNGNEFIRSINDYTEAVFGKSFHEYFYTNRYEYFDINRIDRTIDTDFNELIKAEEVLDFFEKTLRSFLSRISSWEQDIFQKQFLQKEPVRRYRVGWTHNFTATRIVEIEKSLMYELRHEILTSKENSYLISQFKDHLLPLSDIQTRRHLNDFLRKMIKRQNKWPTMEVKNTQSRPLTIPYHTETPLTAQFINLLSRIEILEKNILDFLLILSVREQDIFKKRFLKETPVPYEELSPLYYISAHQIKEIEVRLKMNFRDRFMGQFNVEQRLQWSNLLDAFFHRHPSYPSDKNSFLAFTKEYSSSGRSFYGHFDYLINTYDRSFNEFTHSREVQEVIREYITDFLSNLDADKKAFFQKRFLTNPPIPFNQIPQRYTWRKSNRNIEIEMAYNFTELLKESFETMEPSSFFIKTFFRINDPDFLKKELRRILSTITESDFNSYYLDAS